MSPAASVQMFRDQYLNDPQAHLTKAQIGYLRKLDLFKGASAARGGWMCGGHWYKLATFQQFVAIDLVDITYFNGSRIGLNARGRHVIAVLAQGQQRGKSIG
jgi:hypothetical protein